MQRGEIGEVYNVGNGRLERSGGWGEVYDPDQQERPLQAALL